MSTGLAIAALLMLGFLCQWLAWRVRLPAILFLLLCGLLLGPATGLLDPDRSLRSLLFPLVSLGVAVILFEGSLTLRFAEIRGLGPTILRLVTVGALVTMLGLAAAAHWIADLPWSLALLFGALTCVTGPTVIVPMLRSVRPNARIANVLRWEGIVIDPIGALLAVLVFEALALQHGEGGVWIFLQTVAIGSGIGVAAAFLLALLLRRHWVPDYLHNYATLALLLAGFALSNQLAEESGLLAVTVMGMVLANLRGLHMAHILDFKEHLSTLLISMLFIVLAARLQMPDTRLLLQGLCVLAVAVLLVRPLSVLVSTWGGNLRWPERALVAWIAPRGIVAAAVSALFALKLEQHGYLEAQTLVALTFILIIGTVVLQSATARPLARRLGVAELEPRGVLIVGSSPLARQIALALKQHEFDPLIADEDWPGISAARMAGLRTFFGNPVSEHADRSLDLVGIGWLLALSTRPELNSLACVRYRSEFGAQRVLRLRVFAPGEAPKQAHTPTLLAPNLFGAGTTQAEIQALLDQGWSFKTSRLVPNYSWAQLKAGYSRAPVPVLGVDERGRLHFEREDAPLQPKEGWRVTVLVDPASRIEGVAENTAPAAGTPAPQPAA